MHQSSKYKILEHGTLKGHPVLKCKPLANWLDLGAPMDPSNTTLVSFTRSELYAALDDQRGAKFYLHFVDRSGKEPLPVVTVVMHGVK